MFRCTAVVVVVDAVFINGVGGVVGFGVSLWRLCCRPDGSRLPVLLMPIVAMSALSFGPVRLRVPLVRRSG